MGLGWGDIGLVLIPCGEEGVGVCVGVLLSMTVACRARMRSLVGSDLGGRTRGDEMRFVGSDLGGRIKGGEMGIKGG